MLTKADIFLYKRFGGSKYSSLHDDPVISSSSNAMLFMTMKFTSTRGHLN
jgi:hypothetical protein